MLRRGPARLLTFLVSLGTAAHSAHAQESDGSSPVPSAAVPSRARKANVLYLAGPNCPDESAFWAQVAGHRRNSETLVSLKIRVEVSELDTGAQARVTFVGASGVPATRELLAVNCREAAAAAALVVALALDAQLDERKATRSPPARAVEEPERAPPRASGFPDAADPPARKQRGLFWQFGAGAFAQQAIAPGPLVGAIAFAGIGEHEPAWEARVGVVFAGSGVTDQNDASAEFSLLAAQLQGCAFPIVQAERVLIDPCLAAELGRVQSRGIENSRYVGEEDSSFWAAGGPLIRISYVFSELWLEAYGGPWIPMAGTRDYFFADSQGNRSFHEVPPVGVVGGLRVALHLE